MVDRAVRFLKQHTPNSSRVVARRVLCEAHNARLRLTVPVESRSGYQNVFHCAVRKTASQWVKALLSDPIVYRHSGLLPYDPRPYRWQHPQGFPPGRAVSCLFVSHKKFTTIPKPDHYRTFFVLRDPRDIVVSSYFSTRSSHTPMGDIPEVRKVLQEKPLKEGLLYLIGNLSQKGTFRNLRSWATAPAAEAVRLFRYEDLTGERQEDEVDLLMRHCGIELPPAELAGLLSRYSFSRMRGEREIAGKVSHYRKGKSGDWRNHFDDDIYEAFAAATGDLIELLGYPARD
ncbi:sulfotransferase [Actinoplanes sp. ATCC 53533]|uniref:sulfotransferase domain-containing protein n=1 Tax=Actinoplanes sp. ATCC 53533 TaxID=1288362 RepID=UPI000F76A363|nr:sulfotransferase domain-containing protein [Actinoplanes sp. ATCC 53533]RSM65034.1 sulfotransferase [Actinoplanes sp. ATCC 53533]